MDVLRAVLTLFYFILVWNRSKAQKQVKEKHLCREKERKAVFYNMKERNIRLISHLTVRRGRRSYGSVEKRRLNLWKAMTCSLINLSLYTCSLIFLYLPDCCYILLSVSMMREAMKIVILKRREREREEEKSREGCLLKTCTHSVQRLILQPLHCYIPYCDIETLRS